jgi:hypothetical protein
MAFPALVAVQLLLLIAGVAGGRTNSPLQFLRQPSDNVGTRWAVLVAGSKGYLNYRHQADVCHAYQILRNGGLKDENIIVFMYDDIAYNAENPWKGVIINSPQGGNVYPAKEDASHVSDVRCTCIAGQERDGSRSVRCGAWLSVKMRKHFRSQESASVLALLSWSRGTSLKVQHHLRRVIKVRSSRTAWNGRPCWRC